MFERSFCHPIFTVTQSSSAVSVAVQFLQTTIEVIFGTFFVNDCVRLREPLLVALSPSAVSLIDFMRVNKMIYDHFYELKAVIMACETMKAVN